MKPKNDTAPKRALLLHGGWEEHQPQQLAQFASAKLLHDFETVASSDLGMLRPDILAGFDLLVLVWTYGELSREQETALIEAVAGGMGMVAWHGVASAFLGNRPYKFLLGGQFVAHPGDEGVTYDVNFLGNDPLVEGLEDVRLTSEQYYLLVDPAVKVLATTRMDGAHMPWVAGVEMPVAWTRSWDKGRVFYCSLGHRAGILEKPPVLTLLRRAALWAAR